MIEKPSSDLWQYLKSTNKSVLMYGMGNGADKILSVCERHGIEIADFFASDGFVRGHSFHGKRVLSYSEATEKYGRENIIILVSFATRLDGVLENIYRIADECELYAPDVPVWGNEIFDGEYFSAYEKEINDAEELFCDEESKRIYRGIISYKLTGKIEYLRKCESDLDEAYHDILGAHKFETTADLGAYNGDSIRELRGHAPALTDVIALEPDRRNFRKLTEYATAAREAGDACRLWTVQAGAWVETTTLHFHASGNRNAGVCDRKTAGVSTFPADEKFFGKTVEVPVTSLDEILGSAPISEAVTRLDYIKYDVEGAELEALQGSRAVIERDAPALLVSVYHRSEDLFRIPSAVHAMQPVYRLYLRRMAGIPAWDINLYAVAE